MTTMHIGLGFDVHAFAPNRPLILGGLTIPSSQGLAGHSDADVVLHALVDALLGASALGDIGMYFPSHETQWKNQASSLFLIHTCQLLQQHRWTIQNIDITIIAEQCRIAPYRETIRSHLVTWIGLSKEHISIKATTTDRLGFTGRGEGIACYAIALLEHQEECVDPVYKMGEPDNRDFPEANSG